MINITANYREMFDTLKNYLDNNIQADLTILKAVEDRRKGKVFSFSEHLSGLVFSLLSKQRDWKPILENKDLITKIFFDFDAQKIKSTDYHYFINELKIRKLGNRSINKQMETLNYNIEVLEKLASQYDSIDNFVTSLDVNDILKKLANYSSPYKLKEMGEALVLEYLRNIGIDTIKPDVHVTRILNRLNLLHSDNPNKVLDVMKRLSNETNYSLSYLDFLLWHYCAESFGNVCSETPKCNICVIRKYCKN